MREAANDELFMAELNTTLEDFKSELWISDD
jgi:hypothetical protein